MRIAIMTLLACGFLASGATAARADLWTKAASETAEYALKKFGVEAVQEGSEALSKKIAAAAARHGDDALSAVRKVGPKALTLADEAGENAPRVMRLLAHHGDDAAHMISNPRSMALFAKYGDDAAEVLIKHKGIAADLMESAGDDAIKALGVVGPRNGRRIAMMAKDGGPEMAGLMGVVARHGDPAMEFIWKHKATLAGGAALAAFVANPEPFINGTNQLATTVGENAIKPGIQETARTMSSLVWTLLVLTLGTSAVVVYFGVNHPEATLGAGKALIGVIRSRSN